MSKDKKRKSWIEVVRFNENSPGYVHSKETKNGQVQSHYIGKELSSATVLYLKIAKERKVPIRVRHSE